MQDLQAVFARLQVAKKRQKDIRSMYKDALDNTPGYKELVEELKAKRDKKKEVETAIKQQFSKEMIELDDLKVDIESDNILLTDIALTEFVQGHTVEVSDEYENQYEPVFKVSFKKVN